jgi:hypothetical protein
MTKVEECIVRDAQAAVNERPEVTSPTVEFKREWAYGNAGLEDSRITREQVDSIIQD